MRVFPRTRPALSRTAISSISLIFRSGTANPICNPGLLRNLRLFLMELGDGFAFVGEKVRVQVGNLDFELDLLFYRPDLQCLVGI
jgi:nuclease YhcG-like protein